MKPWNSSDDKFDGVFAFVLCLCLILKLSAVSHIRAIEKFIKHKRVGKAKKTRSTFNILFEFSIYFFFFN